MAEANSGIPNCSKALLLLGLKPIQSFDGSDKGTVCAALYEVVVDSLLRAYPWQFAKTKKKLGRLTAAPINEWTYAYQLPSDRMGEPRAVFNSDAVGALPTPDFEIFGDKLFSNDATIWVDYPFRPDESLWPPHFRQLVIYACAAHFADALTDETSKMQFWWQVAFGTPAEGGQGGYMRSAKAIDANSSPPQVIQDYSLIEVRMG